MDSQTFHRSREDTTVNRSATWFALLTFVSFTSLTVTHRAFADEPAINENAVKSWQPMEGKWVSCEFGGDGPIETSEDVIKVGVGDPLTGVRWTGQAPKESYEIELQARRTEGFDFFCGLTFPVGDNHVTFVLGGWGGGVVGISNIDGLDASENEQTYYRQFKNGTWHKVRVRVDPHLIQTWIDDEACVVQPRVDHTFDVRFEMELCFPIGVAAYQCDAEYKNMRIRKLTEAEIVASKTKADQLLAEDE